MTAIVISRVYCTRVARHYEAWLQRVTVYRLEQLLDETIGYLTKRRRYYDGLGTPWRRQRAYEEDAVAQLLSKYEQALVAWREQIGVEPIEQEPEESAEEATEEDIEEIL